MHTHALHLHHSVKMHIMLLFVADFYVCSRRICWHIYRPELSGVLFTQWNITSVFVFFDCH